MKDSTIMTSAPEILVLSSLQDLLDAWSEENLDTVIEKCTFLLKKNINLDSSLKGSVQRILVQSWLEKEEYSKAADWIEQNNQMFPDLKHYAQYRMEQYEKVSKNASKDSSLEQHLSAPVSYTHLTLPTKRIV